MTSSRRARGPKGVAEGIAEFYRRSYGIYRKAVLTGKRLSSRAEMQKVKRQENDLKNGVPGYVFDMDIGIKPLVWMALNLRFPSGDKRGKPMKLEPWQAYDIIVLFGWVKDDGTKERRFIDAFIEIARKNGKSTFAAAILDYLTWGEIEGARCYIGATSLEQAEESFTRAGDALDLAHRSKDAQGNWRSEVQIANSKNNKQISWKSGMIRAIAAEPKDGKLAYGAIMDEYHQHKSNDLIESIHSGNVSDIVPLLIRITTAGVDMQGVCHEEYMKCLRILSGETVVDRYFVSIYELDQEDDPCNPDLWEKANPNLGVSVKKDLMMGNFEYARSSETDFIAFKTKNLNLWCHGFSRWANMTAWNEGCCWDYPLEDLEGKVAYGGLDLSAVSDFTAFTLDFPIKGKHVQLTHFWIPHDSKDKIQRECRIPLDQWIADGYVTATPGPVIDYTYVAEYIEDACNRYKVPYVAVDRWNIPALLAVMPEWFGEIAYEFSQGMKTMSPTIKAFERCYLEGNLTALGNPVETWMMDCCDVAQDTNGNVKLVKPKRHTAARIDGVITGVMALDCANTHDMPVDDVDIEKMFTFF